MNIFKIYARKPSKSAAHFAKLTTQLFESRVCERRRSSPQTLQAHGGYENINISNSQELMINIE